MTKILLMDDSKFLRMATERALLRAGYEVTTASDGMEAIKLARSDQPDLILLDAPAEDDRVGCIEGSKKGSAD